MKKALFLIIGLVFSLGHQCECVEAYGSSKTASDKLDPLLSDPPLKRQTLYNFNKIDSPEIEAKLEQDEAPRTQYSLLSVFQQAQSSWVREAENKWGDQALKDVEESVEEDGLINKEKKKLDAIIKKQNTNVLKTQKKIGLTMPRNMIQ